MIVHYWPLPLSLHDDAIAINHCAQRGHGLMGLEACQGQIDGAVHATDVERCNEVAPLVNVVDDTID